MSATRITFDRHGLSCAACGVDLPDETPPTRFDIVEPAVELQLCDACRTRTADDGPPPPPFVPAFRFDGELRLPIVTVDDLGVLLRAVAHPTSERRADPDLDPLLERSADPRLADHEAWVERVRRPGRKPDLTDIAGLLVTGALLGIEPETVDVLLRLVERANGGDELGICFGAYCARMAGVRRWRPHGAPPVGRPRRLLEQADRTLLISTPPQRHPLSVRAAQIRLGVVIALERAKAADALFDRIGEDDPRSQLLRGLRFAQKDHLGAADREFRAACENPFAGFDAEIDGAAIWNRTMRALTGTRVDEARTALRAYCRLQPDDVQARVVLGHAYIQAARDDVAREVLGGVFDDTAVAHLRALADAPDGDASTRTEGRLLYASCLQRLGDPRAARQVLEPELDADPETATRRAEVLRLAARCALDLDAEEDALGLLEPAFELAPSTATAREASWAAALAARTRLGLHGLPGLFDLIERRPWIGDALRKRFGTAHAFLCANFALHQLRGAFRPQNNFGMDWSWIGARGANAQTSTFQAYASLARHQIANALQHDLAAQGAGAAAVPLRTLTALFAAARSAPQDQIDALIHLLAEVAQRALRDLDPTR